MIDTVLYIFFQVICCYVINTDCTECYNCNGGVDEVCNITVVCPDVQICYKKTIYEDGHETNVLGCEDKQLCNDGEADGAGLVGREIHLFSRSSDNTTCHECCTGDLCNQNLCTHTPSNSECTDDPRIDCATLDSLVNHCEDTEKAIATCPLYCNLCPIDGGWSDWSDWSSCNVTCDSGIQTRIRHCDNPTPLNGGLSCKGETDETNTCKYNPCPVNGGWSVWSEWGTCSATCDVGIQRRDRHCTNPYPDQYGDHCFGDSRDDKICISLPCANGGWSTWGAWGTCTASCGGGLQERQRQCNNPAPSAFGQQCEGNNFDITQCNLDSCPQINGKWSSWGSWGSCSVSCDGGLMKRQRTCTNPAPSSSGQQCGGNDIDTDTCNMFVCRGKYIAFFAWHGRLTSAPGTPTFPNPYYNNGSAYNARTGEFTAPVSGMYSFTTHICANVDNYFHFYIRKNGQTFAYSRVYQSDSYQCSSATGTTQLEGGDIVNVYSSGVISPQLPNTFTGHLVFSFE